MERKNYKRTRFWNERVWKWEDYSDYQRKKLEKKGKERGREREREPGSREEEKSRRLSETYLYVNGDIKKK